MTPLIDIVFLLLIFFLVVFQFIETERFEVNIPDKCEFAEDSGNISEQITTVTIMKTEQTDCGFAVGAEKIDHSEYSDTAGKIAWLIDTRLQKLEADKRVVILRIDKDVRFAQAKYALAGIAESCAENIKLAVVKNSYRGE